MGHFAWWDMSDGGVVVPARGGPYRIEQSAIVFIHEGKAAADIRLEILALAYAYGDVEVLALLRAQLAEVVVRAVAVEVPIVNRPELVEPAAHEGHIAIELVAQAHHHE